MAKTAKLTKTQTANLNRIWVERVAAGMIHESREYQTSISKTTCDETGFAQMHRTASYSLISKGLARVLVTKTQHTSRYGTFRVMVLVLTDAGRKVICV